MFLKFALVLLVVVLSACSSLATDTHNYKVIDAVSLSDELKETSGLYCPEQDVAYTVNDSGNAPIIYKLNGTGEIQAKLNLNVKNQDWEAITGDAKYYYVGDIGNNSGKRQFVKIHTVQKRKSPQVIKTTTVYYDHNPIEQHKYQGHDFDAESLVSVDDTLYMFSKSWLTGVLSVYKVSKDLAEQRVKALIQVEGLPGIITGGDYDPINQRFVLVGYALKGVGNLYPFITILDKQFNITKSFPLENYNQVEGICSTPNGDIWITQERSFLSSQKLVKLRIN
jgi:hypothetical protein